MGQESEREEEGAGLVWPELSRSASQEEEERKDRRGQPPPPPPSSILLPLPFFYTNNNITAAQVGAEENAHTHTRALNIERERGRKEEGASERAADGERASESDK